MPLFTVVLLSDALVVPAYSSATIFWVQRKVARGLVPRGEQGCRQLNHQVLSEREREVCRRGGGHIIDAPTNSIFVLKFAIDREARSPLRGMATIIVKLSWMAGNKIDE